MSIVVNIDGRISDVENAKVSALDRGFLYGDSVYEVVRTYEGKTFALDLHLDRLERSASCVFMDLPRRDWLIEQIKSTIKAGGNEESYCRIIVTRGGGPITLDPTTAVGRTVVIVVKPYEPFPDWMYTKGLKLAIPAIRRNSPSALDPAIKTGNYLNSILALGEAKRAGFDDALMLGFEGQVTESTSSNVFACKGKKLFTPELKSGLLNGVTRRLLIEIASGLGIECKERDLYPQDLFEADEVMLTSTLKEVMPVVRIDDKVIGSGAPGPTAAMLRQSFFAYAQKKVRSDRRD